MPIGHYVDEVLYNKVPATIVLVAGDAGFKSILQTTVQLELMEIYFWETVIFLEIGFNALFILYNKSFINIFKLISGNEI
ncbi:hypothetical protein RhiirC2_750889 [Rhizophagus irregularis]|uniref:Uncharacterized protein n=1 Tax=Rhizophagus irregularis TaxID=588596 RepID=A0A2N1N2A1_9GLOM|nr:hypothetical protein RhiirC2_750889 [Rhizophagus irregularis]